MKVGMMAKLKATLLVELEYDAPLQDYDVKTPEEAAQLDESIWKEDPVALIQWVLDEIGIYKNTSKASLDIKVVPQ